MQKIKRFIESEAGKDIFTVVIVILVGLSSFGLGRLSKGAQNDGLKVNYPSQSMNNQAGLVVSTFSDSITPQTNTISPKSNNAGIPPVSNSVSKPFFASSRGSKYYPKTCSAGKSIKQANRVYFDTKSEAEKAGYTMSASCK